MTLSYRMDGEGPALVMIHGMGVTFAIWEQLEPLLAAHYKRIIVELPGNGASPACPPGVNYYDYCAEKLEELRRFLEIECWHVLGYSLGAWAARKYLLSYPDRVDRAMFLCPAITRAVWAFGFRLLAAIDRSFPALGSWILRGWRLHGLVRVLGFNGSNPPEAAAWTREISAQPVETIKQALTDLPQAGRAPFTLPELPVRFIWGNRDAVTRLPRPLRPIDRFIPADHSAPVRAADGVAEQILAFFNPSEGDILHSITNG